MTPPRRSSATIFDAVIDESENQEVLRMSASALTTLSKCPFQFYAIYILRIKQSLNHALFFGNVFDDTMNYNYEDKITSGKDLPKDVVQDFFATKFDSAQATVEDWEEQKPKQLREIGIGGVKLFLEEITPHVQVEEVQPKLSMTFKESNLVLTGYPDFIETVGTIGDNKTGGKSKRQSDIDQAIQPVVYSLFKDQLTDNVREVRFDVLVKNKKPKVQQIKTVMTKERRQAGLKYISNSVSYIQTLKDAQNFPPLAFFRPGSWECGYCSASDLCRKTWGLDIPESKTQKVIPVSDETVEKAKKQLKKED